MNMNTNTLAAVAQCFAAGGTAEEVLARIVCQPDLEQELITVLQRLAENSLVGWSHLYWGEMSRFDETECAVRVEKLKSLLPSVCPEEQILQLNIGTVLDRMWLNDTAFETSGGISIHAVDLMIEQTLDPGSGTTWLFLGGQCFGRLVTDLAFMQRFRVEANSQLLARGEIGVLRYKHHDIPVLTDVYRHPRGRALRPNEVATYTGPGDWGVDAQLIVEDNELCVSYKLCVSKPKNYRRVLFGA